MRRTICFLIFFYIASLAVSIQLPSIPLPFSAKNTISVDKPGSSGIPQFILDIEHPWLEDNERQLSQYPNIGHAICDKSSPLWQISSQNDNVPPKELFQKLNIDNTRRKRGEDRRPGWKDAGDRMREIKSCPAALEDVRHLHIDVLVYMSKSNNLAGDLMPPLDVPQIFAEVIPSMKNLEHLDFGIGGRASAAFERAFAVANVTLPNVTHLEPGEYSDWLLPRCPNVEVVFAGRKYNEHWDISIWDTVVKPFIDKYEALIEAMQGLPIKHLGLSTSWNLRILDSILHATPNLTALEMDGLLIRDRQMWGLPKGEALRRYLSIVAQFPHLESLRLPPAIDLDLGMYRVEIGCMVPTKEFDEEAEIEESRIAIHKNTEIVEVAAQMVHDILPHLRTFSIGRHSPNVSLSSDGTMEMTWPWTGRKEEWFQSVWSD